MRALAGGLLAILFCLGSRFASVASPSEPSSGIAPIRVIIATHEIAGTCVLVDREDAEDGVTLRFLTSSRLFRTPRGDIDPAWSAVRVYLGESHGVDVPRSDVFVAASSIGETAIIRVVAPGTTLVPRRLAFAVPPSGEAFEIAGYDRHGAPHVVAGRIRVQSTRFVVGDRDTSDLLGCIGAPAISSAGVFGIVSECETGRRTLVSALWMDRWFIEQHLRRSTRTSSRP